MVSLFITLAWEAGARRGELSERQGQYVDLARGLLTFVNDPERGRQTKVLRSRTIPLSREALTLLQAHAAAVSTLVRIGVRVSSRPTESDRKARRLAQP